MKEPTQEGHLSSFLAFVGKVVVVHTVTYFVFGLIMSSLLDYGSLFRQEVVRDFMRPIESSYVALGPLIQPVRGFLFALPLWPIRRSITENRRGWLILWSIFLVFGILGTPAAAPSSLEGLIYSRLPLWYHLIGLPEIMLQTLAFSLVLLWWDRRQREPNSLIQRSPRWSDILKAAMIATFAYMGYAVGSILAAVIAKVEIDMETAASDWKTQFMFVVAFLVNLLFIQILSKRSLTHGIPVWRVFIFFWLIATLVPLGYQLIFLSPMSLPFAILIGFFPAVVITTGMRIGYRQAMPAN